MTMRDIMINNDENLSWCKPISYNGGETVVVVNEGKAISAQDHGKEIRVVPFEFTDEHFVGGTELPCRRCPWFGVCAAMDEEVEDDR